MTMRDGPKVSKEKSPIFEVLCGRLMERLIGAFNPGPQPCGTPIFAEVANIGYPAIQVSWKNASGRFVSSLCDQNSQWHLLTAENGDSNEPDLSQLDGRG
jgi:hypothetical protein